ncbi:Hydroxyacid oxidase 1 [Frankliniella fusca]|uniref:(S)-2-hydroxy-acid oxidase n=1 Tax=Frankliniella fusca TaxID=407009 RepID=A0AAE1LSS1_9NEOP|nr:Hydroxyacid oxidase 1 [Frankliniella fusca]
MSNLVCVDDFAREAHSILPRNALDYYRSGADGEVTLSLNKEALRRLRIRPRMLRDVEHRSTETSALGARVAVPFGVSPTAMQRMAHPDGEVANVRAVSKLGGVYILSTLATTSIEEVARAAPECTRWFQLYIYKDRKITEQLVRRAERAGYKALVLTVDAPVFGLRRADARHKFTLPSHLQLANFVGLGEDKTNGVASAESGSALNEYVAKLFDASLSWRDIDWLKSFTSLPIVLKGVLTREDAILGVEHGVAAIFVSNHGARQLDYTPAAIEALPEITAAVKGRCQVFVDGGFSNGADIFKALALGADMVFVGRPALWGLTHSGQAGVEKVLGILKEELDRTMALAGCTNLKQIDKSMVVHESFYHKL